MDTAPKRKPEESAIQNRELSWLQFNRRVQAEADNPANPLLERAKFLAIVTSNLDEFIQVRYIGVCEGAQQKGKKAQGGLSGAELYRRVNREVLRQNNQQYQLYEGIQSELYAQGVRLYPVFSMTETLAKQEKEIFETEIRPYLRPTPVEDCVPAQKQLHLCVKLSKPHGKESRFVIIALPATLPRVYDLSHDKRVQCLTRLEEIARRHLRRVFPKEEIEHAAAFRIIRNQDFPVLEEAAADIVPAVRDMLEKRRTGRVMRLEAEERMSEEMLNLLMKRFDLPRERRYRVTGPLDLNKLMMSLYSQVKRADLKFAPATPVVKQELMGDDAFERIDRQDYLLYHPYHSFAPIVHLMQLAATDPTVTAVKQTLYRVSANSPIVAALADAARAGKRVTVLFEAHARFDEANNLYWGEKLEHAGCKVLYGIPMMKDHSKITLFERELGGETRRELHLGTGNYHEGTAKLYTDFGLLTADQRLTADAARFFDGLEGAEQTPLESLWKAPQYLQPKLLELIDRERANAEGGKPAHIIAKMNSLSDETVIEALLQAGRAGVRVDLIVRGICCLVPQRLGVSDNVHVCSLVGRNLEHARAFWFENAGENEVYLSSADWMPRNLYKRVELLFPVWDERLRKAVENVLRLQLRDTEKRRVRYEDTSYRRVRGSFCRVNAQETLLDDVEGVFAGTNTGRIVKE